MASEIFHPKLLPWASRGTLAIVDQALFAGSNLLLNVYLARWLSPHDYGVFALAYSLFILVWSLHSAMFVEPMLVFGAGKYQGKLERYVGVLVQGHFCLMIPISLIAGATAITARHLLTSSISNAFVALACATPFILLSWMLRRVFYIELQPIWSTIGGFVYLFVLLGLIFVAHAVGRLSTVTAFITMAVSSVIVNIVMLARFHPQWHFGSSVSPSEVAMSHWRYGRWSVAAACVSWIPLNIYYVLLPAWFGLEGPAVLRALMNVINPVIHVLIALTPLLVPVLVRNRRNGLESMNRTMVMSLLFLLPATSLFSIVAWSFRTQVFHLLYGSKYEQFGSLSLLLLLLSLLAACVTAVLGAGQMALERPDGNFWSYALASVVTVLVGLPLAAWKGVVGAATGFLLSSCVAAGSMYVFYRRIRCKETDRQIEEYTLAVRTAKS